MSKLRRKLSEWLVSQGFISTSSCIPGCAARTPTNSILDATTPEEEAPSQHLALILYAVREENHDYLPQLVRMVLLIP